MIFLFTDKKPAEKTLTDGDNDTLDNMFQSLCSVDGTKRSQNSQNTKNFEDRKLVRW